MMSRSALSLKPRLDERERVRRTSFQDAHVPQDIICMGVRWYVAYPLSYCHVAELMEERGVPVDHATIQLWVVTDSLWLEEALPQHKRPVWLSWRLEATYGKVKGAWRSLYRAVGKHGHPIDLLLTEPRDQGAALRFLQQAIRRNGVPEKIPSEGREASEAARKCYNEEDGTPISILMDEAGAEGRPAATQFYALAASFSSRRR
jgi:putative transposase